MGSDRVSAGVSILWSATGFADDKIAALQSDTPTFGSTRASQASADEEFVRSEWAATYLASLCFFT
jgi:hypothetical protein